MSKAVATFKPETIEVSTLGLTKGTMAKAITPEQFQDYTVRSREARRAAVRADQGAMWDWALVVANATDVSGFIGTDSDSGQVKQGDYATLNGISPAYVSKLLRLGRAVLRFDVRQGSSAWAFLASNNFTKDLSKVLGQSVKDFEADKAGARAAFKSALASAISGDKPAGEVTSRQPGGETNVTEPGGDKAPGLTKGDGVPSTLADMRVLFATVIEPGIHRLTDSEAEQVARDLYKMLKSDRDRRKVLASESKDEGTEDTEQDTEEAPEVPEQRTESE